MSEPKILEMGHAAHFIGSSKCKFVRATHLSNGFIISTVGDYFPDPKGKREEIGLGRFFETYVFLAKSIPESCGCYRPKDFSEIDALHAKTAKEATENHQKMVSKYLKKLKKRGEE